MADKIRKFGDNNSIRKFQSAGAIYPANVSKGLNDFWNNLFTSIKNTANDINIFGKGFFKGYKNQIMINKHNTPSDKDAFVNDSEILKNFKSGIEEGKKALERNRKNKKK